MHESPVQQDLTWLQGLTDWPEHSGHAPLYAEYLLRVQAGQHPEIWDVHGGEGSATTSRGFTLLWVPEESICWLCGGGVSPTWYFAPLTREGLVHALEGVDLRWCSALPYYRSWTRRCTTCDGPLTTADWEVALVLAQEEAPTEPQCDTCFRAACEASLAQEDF
jgi:hypothetical protein